MKDYYITYTWSSLTGFGFGNITYSVKHLTDSAIEDIRKEIQEDSQGRENYRVAILGIIELESESDTEI
jgi:hypothetical protein